MSIALPASLANGRYQLGQLIGRGGMAEVYTALDTRLGRTVAVKIMRSDLTNDEIFLTRFKREAHSVAQLNNPNIVSIYDSGEELLVEEAGNQERVPYLVMEYVKGQTLRAIIKANGALSQRDAEQVMLGVLNALEYSHHMGIIHRDIKPGNIMISEQGVVKVMDFGIARALDDSAATMTQSQGVVGTAQYLSPEQARGENVDMRSDLYSAGCVLYEMLTGRPPFNGDSAVAIAYQHVSEVATPPSAIVPGLPKMWDSICAKAMAKDRGNRYATASGFKNDIMTFMNGGTPVAAAFNPLADLANMKARKAAEEEAATAALPPTGDETAATQAMSPLGPANQPLAGATAQTVAQAQSRKAANAKKRKKKIIISSIAAILALALIGLGAWGFLNRDKRDETTVPTINAQMSKLLAREKVTAAGFKYEEKEDPDSAEPAGTFTHQNPKGGVQAKKGSTVTVWFSSGPQSTKIPDVKGLSQDDARDKLEKAGFKVSPSASIEDSPDVPKNQVTRTDPAGGQSVPKGSSILIYISSGMTKVPDVSGKTLDEAKAMLQHFNITVQKQHSDTVAKDSVIYTDPAANTSVAQGAMVTVNVSDGMAVKDVNGKTLGEAKQILAGIKISVNGPSDDSAIVTGQTPGAGSAIKKDTDTVTLTTEPGNATVPPFDSTTTLGSYKAQLSAAGLNNYALHGPSDGSAKVTAVSPGPGSSVDKNTQINITTSSN
ncbi:putative serine/threonine-protein kinase PknB [Bifidobacterium actinocoloniiforme DSM 22766]|uniref:non-specific serine/threonine protein kinase n=1 Tax=Bifidobacterium actinocoloniiforme DSM 22766 TaxID=1437605 RepID=A0A086YWE0_9BIFI|nr:Stk1 family PASTA domain-containing Ser/Thr kinase [Bifidobacterium actinocoloniiforme]AKV55790.1 serine/threonine protein kinase [Bifidobacterium actinocoloniiforme DSM 22766]KFI38590.1 putative serine/threonine-protein kinase PknB [Bifidobacterium actinocoloniiforme DSM 22766]